jgi:Tol biopolymer transport system component
MNEEGGEVKRLIKNSNRPILEAKWSPDGKKIAFISVKGDSKEYPGFRRVIYVMNADGSERSQVTTRWVSIGGSNSETITYGGAWHLNWSPDSKHLTYSRLIVPEAIGAFDIFQININGKEEKRILNTPRDKHLDYRIMDWANDGGAFWVDILDYSAVDSTGKRFLTRNLGLMDLNGEVLQTWGNQRES